MWGSGFVSSLFWCMWPSKLFRSLMLNSFWVHFVILGFIIQPAEIFKCFIVAYCTRTQSIRMDGFQPSENAVESTRGNWCFYLSSLRHNWINICTLVNQMNSWELVGVESVMEVNEFNNSPVLYMHQLTRSPSITVIFSAYFSLLRIVSEYHATPCICFHGLIQSAAPWMTCSFCAGCTSQHISRAHTPT